MILNKLCHHLKACFQTVIFDGKTDSKTKEGKAQSGSRVVGKKLFLT